MWIALGIVGGLIVGWLVQWWIDVRFWRKAVANADDVVVQRQAEKEALSSERQMFSKEAAQHAAELERLRAKLAEQAQAIERSQQALLEAEQKRDAQAEEFTRALAEVKAAGKLVAEQPVAVEPDVIEEYPQPANDADLQFINGIGPKVKDVLVAAGVNNFAELAEQSVDDLRRILDKAGGRFRLSYPDTWPVQAAFLRDERYEELHAYLEVE